ncbi:hypothetical protein [Candidatus Nitrosacidococcus tergens]|uniref:Type 4 fimbrial biogenesis protein PilX N-terminal domain-containing protein n=1 Tax=Candidatus Nitrosacidococcus tergens TaxID=553981 RepID=A0A7G1Q8L3_9GAMM|nr:hypothetical protein [Candidatus Nitrosacidococcus tergens]CAB1275147.1 protein of unknown function [Candidatus Nitrosacidococcus tergens]
MKKRKKIPVFSQKGLVTLTAAIGMSLLTAITTLHTANMGITRQKISSNSLDTNKNFSIANAAANQDIDSIINNSDMANPSSPLWRACTLSFPCSVRTQDYNSWKYQQNNNVGINNQLSYLLQNTINPSVIIAVTMGFSPTGGQTIVQRGLYLSSAIPGPVHAPMVSGGNVAVNGFIDVGGSEVSIWASDSIQLNGSGTVGGTLIASGTIISNGQDISGVSTPGSVGWGGFEYTPDPNSGNPSIPTDLFQYVFNVPQTQSQSIQNQATQLANCSSLGSNSSGLYWITGQCIISGTNTIGSAKNPVLVVTEGDIILSGSNISVYGLMYSLSNMQLSGNNFNIQGSLAANGNIGISGDANYNEEVLKNLYHNIGLSKLVSIPYSWADY